MSSIKRRKFIKAGAISSLGLLTPVFPSYSHDKINFTNITEGEKSIVAAVKGVDLISMTRDAINALGGIGKFIDEDDRVFIKPNFVNFPWASTNNCFLSGECSKPEIIIAVTEECLRAGASEVIIGEGSHLPTFDWSYAVTFNKRTNLVEEAQRMSKKYKGNVLLACLESDSPSWTEIPSQTPLGKIAISSLVSNADKVISLPVAKTHSWSQVSLAAKNFVGITPLSRYAQWVDNSWWNRGSLDHSSPASIGQVFLDIVKFLKPVLSIIDFSIGIEGNGPTKSNGGKSIDVKDHLGSWLILASADIMAADVSAARIMSQDIGNIKQLSMGYQMGLGNIHENKIDMVGEKLEDLKIKWKPARLKNV